MFKRLLLKIKLLLNRSNLTVEQKTLEYINEPKKIKKIHVNKLGQKQLDVHTHDINELAVLLKQIGHDVKVKEVKRPVPYASRITMSGINFLSDKKDPSNIIEYDTDQAEKVINGLWTAYIERLHEIKEDDVYVDYFLRRHGQVLEDVFELINKS